MGTLSLEDGNLLATEHKDSVYDVYECAERTEDSCTDRCEKKEGKCVMNLSQDSGMHSFQIDLNHNENIKLVRTIKKIMYEDIEFHRQLWVNVCDVEFTESDTFNTAINNFRPPDKAWTVVNTFFKDINHQGYTVLNQSGVEKSKVKVDDYDIVLFAEYEHKYLGMRNGKAIASRVNKHKLWCLSKSAFGGYYEGILNEISTTGITEIHMIVPGPKTNQVLRTRHIEKALNYPMLVTFDDTSVDTNNGDYSDLTEYVQTLRPYLTGTVLDTLNINGVNTALSQYSVIRKFHENENDANELWRQYILVLLYTCAMKPVSNDFTVMYAPNIKCYKNENLLYPNAFIKVTSTVDSSCVYNITVKAGSRVIIDKNNDMYLDTSQQAENLLMFHKQEVQDDIHIVYCTYDNSRMQYEDKIKVTNSRLPDNLKLDLNLHTIMPTVPHVYDYPALNYENIDINTSTKTASKFELKRLDKLIERLEGILVTLG